MGIYSSQTFGNSVRSDSPQNGHKSLYLIALNLQLNLFKSPFFSACRQSWGLVRLLNRLQIRSYNRGNLALHGQGNIGKLTGEDPSAGRQGTLRLKVSLLLAGLNLQ